MQSFEAQASLFGDTKKDLKWAIGTTRLLARLLGSLSETLYEWEEFTSPNGDASYFFDMTGNGQDSLHMIRDTFKVLKRIRNDLTQLKSSLQDSKQEVSCFRT